MYAKYNNYIAIVIIRCCVVYPNVRRIHKAVTCQHEVQSDTILRMKENSCTRTDVVSPAARLSLMTSCQNSKFG